MTEPKFTPGPWHIEIDVCENGIVLLGIFDADDNIICDISDLEPKTKAEAKANANLIAAAPEMYWELVRCANLFRELKIYPVVNVIEDLLLKSRGEREVSE